MLQQEIQNKQIYDVPMIVTGLNVSICLYLPFCYPNKMMINRPITKP